MSDEKELKAKDSGPSDSDLRKMEAELKGLEIQEKRANLQDVQERLAERQMRRDNVGQRARTNGETLKANQNKDRVVQENCNHRKGGNGLAGIVGGQGDDPQFAVMKHQFGNGDVWVRCLRCGKTWKPPVKSNFYFDKNGKVVAPVDGTFDDEKYKAAVKEYREALAFQTRNVSSGSVQYRFSDGGEHFREMTKDSTLR